MEKVLKYRRETSGVKAKTPKLTCDNVKLTKIMRKMGIPSLSKGLKGKHWRT